ncbi:MULTISPECIES: glycosyltransferase family 2 protein [Agrobacterium]|uniref:Glycosyltransferase n=1 Tax=Agrobacterium pusense TaxID=648995 RepID=A0A6H0ZT69_9HYPH|nr:MULTISPECIES: cellulose synthase catalytic subunit [Agrobacterium]ANV26743.1 cellulose synthase [Rhizobium sp. S41]KGE81860.1 cellulose synthase [Rhizobium sp. H41]MDH2090328.1 glycosyltransferase [Agrobacterium pusense]QIX23829.1 glycosyltransferase [Agrobacterium pusense]QWW75763.1 glycosyltransferase [Agrobacterium pusense]
MYFTSEGDVQSVLYVNLIIALCAILFTMLADPRRTLDRLAFSAIMLLSLSVYILWRATDTLPPLELSLETAWNYIYFTFELISVLYAMGSILILTRRTDWSSIADEAEAGITGDPNAPLVDVFICTYNEPLNVLEKSIVAAQAMQYPRLRVFVCDDTRRSEVRDYCETVGVNYVTRPDNKHAKAGNLNNALVHTNALSEVSDFIMVLDADFAPQANFLSRVTGLFADPKVAVVQTPQFYFNSDPIQHNLGIRNSFVDDQRVFFDVFQPAKDAVGCAFCVGTSFVLRRAAVNELGGFPHDALSEDMLLTYRLMERGYVTRWLNEKLSVGLSAEGLPEYITQRTRWCLGTIQIGLLRTGPLWRGNFTLTQRLHYLHGLFCWLSKPFILCLLLAPSIYWLTGVSALQADELMFMQLGLSSLALFWAYSTWISGKRTLPLFTEVTHALTAVPITITLFQAVRKPFGRPFKVTEKGGDRSQVRVHGPTALFFALVTLTSAISVLIAVYGWDAPVEFSARDCLNLIWSAVAMVIAFISLICCIELPRFDREEPISVNLGGQLRQGNAVTGVKIVALSTETVTLAGFTSSTEAQAIFVPEVGWLQIDATKDQLIPGKFCLAATAEQHRAILRLLFRTAPENVAEQGDLIKSMQMLLARAFS